MVTLFARLKIWIAYFNSQSPKTLLFTGKISRFLHRTEFSCSFGWFLHKFCCRGNSQVSDCVNGCVQVGANGPDVYRCYSEDQWCILPWGASDSKANAYHAWDLWRVLYLRARQCSCSQSLRDNQPSETRHLRSFHQTFCHPTAHIWTQFTTKMVWG